MSYANDMQMKFPCLEADLKNTQNIDKRKRTAIIKGNATKDDGTIVSLNGINLQIKRCLD